MVDIVELYDEDDEYPVHEALRIVLAGIRSVINGNEEFYEEYIRLESREAIEAALITSLGIITTSQREIAGIKGTSLTMELEGLCAGIDFAAKNYEEDE